MSTIPPGPQTETLSLADCWKYLQSSYIGRLAVINGTSPEIFPVNFLSVKEILVFRTAPGTKLRALLTGAVVALETDGLNPYGTEVWSVVVKGTPAPFAGDLTSLAEAGPDREPWEPGLKEHLVQIRPTEVSDAGSRYIHDPVGGLHRIFRRTGHRTNNDEVRCTYVSPHGTHQISCWPATPGEVTTCCRSYSGEDRTAPLSCVHHVSGGVT
jgi:nitroimidazol reductase NimA-like FMN-containing flavoprotein (pyridoxamine 5'-phosphate oxidase superfamily)